MSRIKRRKLKEMEAKAVAAGLDPSVLSQKLTDRGFKLPEDYTPFKDTAARGAVSAEQSAGEFAEGVAKERGSWATPLTSEQLNQKSGLSRPLSALGTTAANIIPSAIQTGKDIVGLVGQAVKDPKSVIASIARDPSVFLGTAGEQLVGGITEAIKPGSKGSRANIITDSLEDAASAFQADPLGSIISPKGLVQSAKSLPGSAINVAKSTATGAADVAKAGAEGYKKSGATGAVGNVLSEVGNKVGNTKLATAMTNSWKSMQRAYGDKSAAIVHKRAMAALDTSVNSASGLIDIDSQLSTRRDMMKELETKRAEIDAIDSDKSMADADVDIRKKSIADADAQVKSIQDDISIMDSQRKQLQSDFYEAQKDMFTETNQRISRNSLEMEGRSYDGRPQWTDTSEFFDGFNKQVDGIKEQSYKLFDQSLYGEGGKPISFDATNYLDKLENAYTELQKVGAEGTAKTLRKQISGLLVRNEYTKGFVKGGDTAGKAALDAINPEHAIWDRLDESMRGEDTLRTDVNGEYTSKFWENPNELSYMSKTHNSIRNILKGESNAVALKAFDSIVSDSLRDSILEVLEKRDGDVVDAAGRPVNSKKLAEKYTEAKGYWGQYKKIQKQFNNKETNFETHMRNNWLEYKKILPRSMVEQIQDYFHGETMKNSLDEFREVFNVEKMKAEMKANGDVLTPTAKAELNNYASSLIESQKSIDEVSSQMKQKGAETQAPRESRKAAQEGLGDLESNQSSLKSLQDVEAKNLEDLKNTAKKVGVQDYEFVDNIKKVQSVIELESLSKESGKTPSELLIIALGWDMRNAEAFASNLNADATVKGAQQLLATYDSIASNGQKTEVRELMTQDTPEIKDSMARIELAMDEYERAKGLAKKTKAARVMNLGIGIIGMALSYPLTAIYHLQDAFSPGKNSARGSSIPEKLSETRKAGKSALIEMLGDFIVTPGSKVDVDKEDK